MASKSFKGILSIFLIIFLAFNVHGATLKGTAFEWFSLEPLDGVIIDIDSVPQQRVITQNSGQYSFILPPGEYSLHAEYFENSELVYVEDENIVIADDGEFNLDLIMFPVLTDPDLDDEDLDVEDPFPQENLNSVYNALIGLFAIILVVWFFFLRKKGNGTNNVQDIKEESLDEYAQEVLELLKKSGNRLTQKEIRDKITHIGEAKISLIISELEAAGKIKKIKKGRGNIIVLKE